MATSVDLAKDVLLELRQIEANADPSASDYADIKRRYYQKLEMLLDEDYADWDAESIPDAAMPGLIRVMAHEVAQMYGVDRRTLIEADGRTTIEDKGLALLRRYMRFRPSFEPTRIDYF
jgi:hypothetical protein